MLDNDITIEKMKTGLSKIRNKGIAAAFSYMNVIEAWGSGIPRMFKETKEYGLAEPELIDMGSDFRVNLYRHRMNTDQYGVIAPKLVAKFDETNETNSATDATDLKINSITELNTEEQKILMAIQVQENITQKQLHEVTGISLGTIKRVLPKLQKKGKLERIGNRRTGKWLVKE